jgi:hypothetical protein
MSTLFDLKACDMMVEPGQTLVSGIFDTVAEPFETTYNKNDSKHTWCCHFYRNINPVTDDRTVVANMAVV